MTLKYTTEKQLTDILGLTGSVPNREIGKDPVNEYVGTGNDSETIFYLNQKNILPGTYTLYYGSDETATDELTDETHYDIEEDDGKITLTSDGVTLLSTSKLYSKYKYITNEMPTSFITSVLKRAEKEVNGKINTPFTDGTATNPAFPQEIEIQQSPGYFRNEIIAKKKPLIDIESTADGSVDISQNTIDLLAGTGTNFPSSGYIVIGSEVMSYTGITTDQLTGVTRGVLGSDAATHEDGDDVHSTILFLSNSIEGAAVEWTVQPWDTGMHANENSLFYSYSQSIFNSSQYSGKLAQQDVANRTRMIYYYGYDTIPLDITRLTLMLAKRQLIQDNVGKSMIAGRNEFRPEMFNVDMTEIESIINDYIIFPMGNT